MAKDDRIGKKIKILEGEGKTYRQALGEALGMQDAGRLGPNGEYYRVGKKRGGSRGGSRR